MGRVVRLDYLPRSLKIGNFRVKVLIGIDSCSFNIACDSGMNSTDTVASSTNIFVLGGIGRCLKLFGNSIGSIDFYVGESFVIIVSG